MFTACNNSGNAETLSLYDIVANFNEAASTLECREEVCYINRATQGLDKLMFSLPPSAFREDAAFSPFTASERNSVFYNGIDYGGIEILSVEIEGFDSEFTIGGEDENILIVPVGALDLNDSINIEIEFNVKLPKCNARMGITQSTVNLGNFYPQLCVFENGNFETHPYYSFGDPFYSESADYLVTLSFPEKYVAATSGAVEESYVENGIRYLEINAPQVRDFAATLSKNFKVLSNRVNGIDVNYYYTYDTNAALALETATKAIETFSDNFGVYPYPVFNVAQVHINSGGMEYSNLVFISSILSGQNKEETIIHETAHQWWYGVVGGNQIKNAWLDEGLTEFSTAYYFRLNGDYERYTNIIGETLSGYVNYFDTLKAADPAAPSDMNRAIPQYKTESEYVILTYYKGALMFASLLEMYGDKKITKVLNEYYSENAYKIASPDCLLEIFEKHCKGTDILLQNWLNGTVIIG